MSPVDVPFMLQNPQDRFCLFPWFQGCQVRDPVVVVPAEMSTFSEGYLRKGWAHEPPLIVSKVLTPL